MKQFKLLIITLFVVFSSLTGITYAESLKFAESTYEGEVKKGKAHGVGIFTFSDGSIYQGKVSKNRIHGIGKYTDAKGKVFDGKFKYGTLRLKIDKKTRDVVKLRPKIGAVSITEMKGKSAASGKWFEAKKNSSGTYELTAEGKIAMAEVLASGGAADTSDSSGGSGC